MPSSEHPAPKPDDNISTTALKHSNRCLADRLDLANRTLKEKEAALEAAEVDWLNQQKILSLVSQQCDQMDEDINNLFGAKLNMDNIEPLFRILSQGIKSKDAVPPDVKALLDKRTERMAAIVRKLCDLVQPAPNGEYSGSTDAYSTDQAKSLVTTKAELELQLDEVDKKTQKVKELQHELQNFRQKNTSLKRRLEETKANASSAVETASRPTSSVAPSSAAQNGGRVDSSKGDVQKELLVLETQLASVQSKLADSKKQEAHLRLNHLALEASQVKNSPEYKHLYQLLQDESKGRIEDRESSRAQIDDLFAKLSTERAESSAVRVVEQERQTQILSVLDQLKGDIEAVSKERNKLKLELDTFKAAKNDKHSTELQSVIQTLKKEQKANRSEVKRLRRIMRERLLKCARDWEGDSQVIIDALKEETNRAVKAEKDLKLLINVHQNVSKDRREKVAISFSMQKAKDELAELKQKISSGEVGNENDCKVQLQKASKKIETLEIALKECKATEEVLIQELESTGSSLDEIQEQNGRLLKQLKDKESTTFELMAAKLAADQAAKAAENGRIAGQESAKAFEAVITKKDKQIQALKDNDRALREAIKASDKKMRDAEIHFEKGKKDLDSKMSTYINASIQINDLQSQLDKTKDGYMKCVETATNAEEQTAKLARELEKSKQECQRLKREGLMNSGGDSGMRKLVLDLNKRLKCTLCKENEKNAVISTCMHVFCFSCLDSQIKNRNRKCPICKNMFGQNDIKRVWLDFGEEENS